MILESADVGAGKESILHRDVNCVYWDGYQKAILINFSHTG